MFGQWHNAFRAEIYHKILLSYANCFILLANAGFALHEKNVLLFSSFFLILVQFWYFISNSYFWLALHKHIV